MSRRLRRFGLVSGVVALLVVLVGSMIGLTVHHGTGKTTAKNSVAAARTTSPITETPQLVKQPAVLTAKQVASNMGCTNYVDEGSAPAAKVLDFGHCWMDGLKYAVDTFANTKDRDLWIANTAGYGVHVLYKSKHAVVYPSVDN